MIEKWSSTSLPGWPEQAGSGSTFALTSTQWIPWMHSSTQFNRGWVSFYSTNRPYMTNATTAKVVARLLTERIDPKDFPYDRNYNEYLYIRSTDGGILRSPPLKTKSPRHWLSVRPSTLDDHEFLPST